MEKWKKVVLVIKKEDLLFRDGTLCKSDISFAWYCYTITQLGLYPLDLESRWLTTRNKEFKRTWHVTIKFRKKEKEYED